MSGQVRLKGARKAIADHMMQSLAGSAQLSFLTGCDVTDLLTAREGWKAGERAIGVEDCLIAALADSMAAFPHFNGVSKGDELILAEAVDVSVAISVNGLLLTPVIRRADRLSLDEIAACRRDQAARARSGKLKTSELVGGTATISNLGLTRVRHFTPILNKGQLVILGIGRIEPRLMLTADGSVAQRQEIGLSLTVDHRFIDGDPAARLLGEICDRLTAIHTRN
ncbi:MAG: 2-oxo acid dehydrogenase subunit E2 [Hyphomonas sp.]|nr:2-oxo acid dehydrogenase subunit E2 [Hyphomonas sp.]MCB9971144.1 2-oxo acid dehydrogenase subunit E2 [Hyphomonas sp.]